MEYNLKLETKRLLIWILWELLVKRNNRTQEIIRWTSMAVYLHKCIHIGSINGYIEVEIIMDKKYRIKLFQCYQWLDKFIMIKINIRSLITTVI